MKTIELSREYRRLSLLDEKDKVHFKRISKGGISDSYRYEPSLYIVPIPESPYILACKGFRIEHHQIIFSKATEKAYLVFRQKPVPRGEFPISYYHVFLEYFMPPFYPHIERIHPKHIGFRFPF